MNEITNSNAKGIDLVTVKNISGEYFYYRDLSLRRSTFRYIEILAELREVADNLLLEYLNNGRRCSIDLEVVERVYPFNWSRIVA